MEGALARYAEALAELFQRPERLSSFNRTWRRLSLCFGLGLVLLIAWEYSELEQFFHSTVLFR